MVVSYCELQLAANCLQEDTITYLDSYIDILDSYRIVPTIVSVIVTTTVQILWLLHTS